MFFKAPADQTTDGWCRIWNDGEQVKCQNNHVSLAFLSSLSKHLPSAEAMSLNVDVDELENSHGATYVRKKAAKAPGEILPKEQG